jgi:hypothetical protein
MPFSRISPHTRLMPVLDVIRSPRGTIDEDLFVLPLGQKHPRSRRRPLPPLNEIKLQSLRADQLRIAIRNNLVSFPSQVPVFERHDRPDLQRRIVQLYFVLGWSCATIAARYGMLRQRIGQVLSTWKRRAVEMGYIQYIPPPPSLGRTHTAIRIVLSPVVEDASATVAVDVPRQVDVLPPVGVLPRKGAPVWLHSAHMLMTPIKKSYSADI